MWFNPFQLFLLMLKLSHLWSVGTSSRWLLSPFYMPCGMLSGMMRCFRHIFTFLAPDLESAKSYFETTSWALRVLMATGLSIVSRLFKWQIDLQSGMVSYSSLCLWGSAHCLVRSRCSKTICWIQLNWNLCLRIIKLFVISFLIRFTIQFYVYSHAYFDLIA